MSGGGAPGRGSPPGEGERPADGSAGRPQDMAPDRGDPDDPGGDQGLARQRTALAWTRTALSFAALGAVILKAHPIPGLAILGLSVLIFPLGRLPWRPGSASRTDRRLLLITVAVTGVSAAALVISLVTRQPAG
jgi:uncharacterized membrane protein YidH (DUF202 family)